MKKYAKAFVMPQNTPTLRTYTVIAERFVIGHAPIETVSRHDFGDTVVTCPHNPAVLRGIEQLSPDNVGLIHGAVISALLKKPRIEK